MPLRLLAAFLLLGTSPLLHVHAQVPLAPPKPTTRNTEPGLEEAVKWKWQVSPAENQAWGQTPLSVAQEVVAEPTAAPTAIPESTGGMYEVKSGDRLVFIAKKHGVTVEQLKGFNQLQTDMIRVGQVLNIPTREQAILIAPFPVERKAPAKPGATPAGPSQSETLALQIFLDREGFSAGPIDGKPSPLLDQIAQLYLSAHPESGDLTGLRQKAVASVGDLYTSYTLRAQDFGFIIPPKAQRYEAPAAPGAAPKPKSTATFDDLTSAPVLAYKGPWEFVAERFHTEESFLRSINDQITTVPQIGTTLRVPRVEPFLIESSLLPPLQPAPDVNTPVTAAIRDLTIMEISKGGKLIAAMPVASARPGLRGRGAWTILNAIPRPQLTTMQEPTAAATPPPPLYGANANAPTPTPTPTPAPRTLACGPNNPAGIIWINLAKADSTTPLPYGLHGTSIPDHVKQMDSIGGFRMTNWNIARAARLLPNGTPLEWKQAGLSTAASPANTTVAPAIPVAPALPAGTP